MKTPVSVALYRWAGKFGPFEVKIPCGECTLTKDILKDAFENELSDIDIVFEVKDWLSNWWEPLFKGGWHAPIVMVNGKIISQGEALNRGVLVQEIVKASLVEKTISGNVVFGKAGCPYCKKAKDLLNEKGIAFEYRDVVKDSVALYTMIPLTKKHIGEKTPVTVPQIWLEGEYIGGFDQLSEKIK